MYTFTPANAAAAARLNPAAAGGLSPALLLIPILLPLLCGGFLLIHPILNDAKRARYTEIAACVTSLSVFCFLFTLRRGEGATIYRFTNHPAANFSVGFLLDGPAMLFAGMVSVMWPLALLYAFAYMKEERKATWRNRFFSFYLMTYGVTLGIAFAENLVTMYVFFEMLTLITIPLVYHWQDPDSNYASRVYTAYCVAGASLGFIAVVIGTMDGSGSFRYGGNLAGEYAPALMRTVYLFGFFGFGTKAAVFPFFDWLPKASVAPTPVTALLHAVAVVNSGVYAVARLSWYAFGPDLLYGSREQAVCIFAAAFSMVFAAVMALRQRHFKRRLAYSTMSNLSYILFGLALLTPEGFAGGLSHMFFHGIIKMALFLCAGAWMHVTENAYLYELDGAGRQMPVTFACYTLGALSLTGIPLFCGFVSKWRLLTAGIAAASVPRIAAVSGAQEALAEMRAAVTGSANLTRIAAMTGTGALIAAAFLCAMYTLTVSVRAFFPVQSRYPARIREADWRMLFPAAFFTAANVLFGVWSGPIMAFVESIARGMI